jgi:hypothetical protein
MMQVLLEPPKGYTKKVLNYGPYSPSRLIAGKCPARFFAQYVRKDKIVSHSIASARGTAIHEILEKITKAMQAGTILTTKQVNEWVTESVGKHPAAYAQIDLIKEAADAYVRMPSPYISSTTECEKAVAVELWVEDTWDDTSAPKIAFVSVPYVLPDGRTNPDCFFGGKIDQHTVDHQTRTVTILDHKSTPSANEKEDHTFQVGAYAWLVGLFYPGYTIKTVIHYAHPRLSFISSPVYWYEQDLDMMQHEILIKINALESYQSFEALPGNACDYCHIVQECTVYEKVREQKTKGTIDLNTRSVEDLIRLGKELYVVDQMATQLQKALKEGIDKLCPINGINIGGVSYGYKKSEGVDWEATNKKIGEESRRAQGKSESKSYESEEDRRWCEEIAQHKDIDSILRKHQVDPNLFKTYNGTKMKSIWKFDKPELMETLKKVVVIDGSTRFGTSKD